MSILSSDPFADIADYASTFRATDPTQFYVRDPETNEVCEARPLLPP
jgi:hypothetical protein